MCVCVRAKLYLLYLSVQKYVQHVYISCVCVCVRAKLYLLPVSSEVYLACIYTGILQLEMETSVPDDLQDCSEQIWLDCDRGYPNISFHLALKFFFLSQMTLTAPCRHQRCLNGFTEGAFLLNFVNVLKVLPLVLQHGYTYIFSSFRKLRWGGVLTVVR